RTAGIEVDQHLDVAILGELHDVARPLDDHPAVEVGLGHRLDHLGLRRGMHDHVEALAVHRLEQRPLVSDVGDAQRDGGRAVLAGAGREIVDRDDEIAARHERIREVAADEAGAAGHEHAQGLVAPLWMKWWTSWWMKVIPFDRVPRLAFAMPEERASSDPT